MSNVVLSGRLSRDRGLEAPRAAFFTDLAMPYVVGRHPCLLQERREDASNRRRFRPVRLTGRRDQGKNLQYRASRTRAGPLTTCRKAPSGDGGKLDVLLEGPTPPHAAKAPGPSYQIFSTRFDGIQ
jgi:hypothetical protein